MVKFSQTRGTRHVLMVPTKKIDMTQAEENLTRCGMMREFEPKEG